LTRFYHPSPGGGGPYDKKIPLGYIGIKSITSASTTRKADPSHHHLFWVLIIVGDFNPFEKYTPKIGSFPKGVGRKHV